MTTPCPCFRASLFSVGRARCVGGPGRTRLSLTDAGGWRYQRERPSLTQSRRDVPSSSLLRCVRKESGFFSIPSWKRPPKGGVGVGCRGIQNRSLVVRRPLLRRCLRVTRLPKWTTDRGRHSGDFRWGCRWLPSTRLLRGTSSCWDVGVTGTSCVSGLFCPSTACPLWYVASATFRLLLSAGLGRRRSSRRRSGATPTTHQRGGVCRSEGFPSKAWCRNRVAGRPGSNPVGPPSREHRGVPSDGDGDWWRESHRWSSARRGGRFQSPTLSTCLSRFVSTVGVCAPSPTSAQVWLPGGSFRRCRGDTGPGTFLFARVAVLV